ncbi:MAG: hypothetical protein U9N73_09750 [Candidatus Auribacterota bacterium]|nr:hypothetical protein [Candidatus Auribacterota bacterium]
MAISYISSILLTFILLVPPFLYSETSELADRTGLESAWKKSGRTTRVIDYPYSPQPGIYGGKDIRRWENKGYLFRNPKTDEFTDQPGRRVEDQRIIAPDEVEGEDCPELRRELEEEIARNAAILEEKKQLAEKLRNLGEKADDQSFKINALEFEIEELEKEALTATSAIGAVSAVPEAGLTPGQTGTYLVQDGENLWEIAGKPEVYDDPYRWLLLYHANRDQIFEPDLIYPGMVLLVPHYPGLEEMDRSPDNQDISAETELVKEKKETTREN